MKTKLLSIVLLLSTLFNLSCELKVHPVYVYSPDMDICVIVSDSTLKVKYKNEIVQQVRIDVEGLTDWSVSNLQKDSYNMLSGKRSECTNYYNELVYDGADGKALVVRAYHDGVAFRMVDGDEDISYVIPDGQKRWLQRLKTDYEGFYPESTSAVNGRYGYPALVEYADGVFGLITESGIGHGNSCSFLTCSGQDYTVTYTDSIDMGPHPWRIIMLGSLADIVESTLVTDLADECKIEDASWILPITATKFMPGKNFSISFSAPA